MKETIKRTMYLGISIALVDKCLYCKHPQRIEFRKNIIKALFVKFIILRAKIKCRKTLSDKHY